MGIGAREFISFIEDGQEEIGKLSDQIDSLQKRKDDSEDEQERARLSVEIADLKKKRQDLEGEVKEYYSLTKSDQELLLDGLWDEIEREANSRGAISRSKLEELITKWRVYFNVDELIADVKRVGIVVTESSKGAGVDKAREFLVEFGRFELATPDEMTQAKQGALAAIKGYVGKTPGRIYHFELLEIMRGFGLFPGENIKGEDLLKFYDEVRELGIRIAGLDLIVTTPVWR